MSTQPQNVSSVYNNSSSYLFKESSNHANKKSSVHSKLRTPTHSRDRSFVSSHSKGIHRAKSYNQNLKKGIHSSSSYKYKSKQVGKKNKDLFDPLGIFPLQSSNLRKASKLSEVTGVARLSLHHNPPVNGCKIEPYVILKCENGGFVQSDDKDCKFTWYRSKKRICFAHNCDKPAFLQCLTCSKLKIEHKSSYYCTTRCMLDCWMRHKELHKSKEKYDVTKWNCEDEAMATNEWKVKNSKECSEFVEDPNSLYCKFPPPITNKWEKIAIPSNTKRYKPTSSDIGRQLLLECTPTIKEKESENGDEKKKKIKKVSKPRIINESQDTSPCLPRPPLSFCRSMHYLHSEHPLDKEVPNVNTTECEYDNFTFRVMSYNCLAPIYCTRSMYPYVEPFKLEWDYRKYNIKREILRYKPDVICLQEVQHNHFDDYFTKELSKEGYEGMYRPKSRGSRDPKSVDGCAIFFKSARFKVSQRYHIDFNDTSTLYLNILQNKESSKPMSDEQIKNMSKRLNKGNIALIVVLEEKERKNQKESAAQKGDGKNVEDEDENDNNNKKGKKSNAKEEDDHKTNKKQQKKSINICDHNTSLDHPYSEKRQICIANTHVFWDPQFTDVKIWQSWILCEEISRALGRELPLILCGDFNSEPKSAVYEYLTKGRVESTTYDDLVKEYELSKGCLLPPRDNLRHRLGLKSHYNHNGKEPNYTNYTRHYKGTLDYVLYSSKSLESIGYLEELSIDQLSKEEAFPNSTNSSDHIPLMGTFAFSRDYQKWLTQKQLKREKNKYHHRSSRYATSSSNASSSIRPAAAPRHRHGMIAPPGSMAKSTSSPQRSSSSTIQSFHASSRQSTRSKRTRPRNM